MPSRFPDDSGSSSLLVLDTTRTPPLPLPIKLGDANLDRYTNFLFIINPLSVQRERTPKLALSVPCSRGVAGCNPDGSGRKVWNVVRHGVHSLEIVTDARGVAFLDMDDALSTHKSLVLNDACNDWCTIPALVTIWCELLKHYIQICCPGHTPIGAPFSGSIRLTSYHSLFTPYLFFGLGRTNNYIENLFVGSTWEGVIPNSKVDILPPSNDPNAPLLEARTVFETRGVDSLGHLSRR